MAGKAKVTTKGVKKNNDSVIKKEIVVNNMSIKVVKKNVSEVRLLKAGVISESDANMDQRVKAAVSEVKRSAKICNKPIAIYDRNNQEAVLITAE